MEAWKSKAAVVLAVTAFKVALIPAYRSTDFEVHRNWLAITSSLPLQDWYIAEGSEWTLDYPPLFAWFEYGLAQVARFFDPAMLKVENHGYASPATVLFQRGSVIFTDSVLVSAAWFTSRKMPQAQSLAVFTLIVAHPALIIVDHIHFQYNGILLGILVWSIALIKEERCLLGAFLFAVLVNMKHLFASLGPLYLVYLLRRYCRGPYAVQRFLSLGAIVLSVCAVSFGPFILQGQLQQVLQRLFPFGRGLNHAYWAANVWALYTLADKVLARVLHRTSGLASSTGGLVQTFSFTVLPDIGPTACTALSLAAMLPVLLVTFRKPVPEKFPKLVAYMALCSFMLGYHVHEKAVLTVLIPLAMAAGDSLQSAREYMFLSLVGTYALFPLLFTWQEYPIKVFLYITYHLLALLLLSHMSPSASVAQGKAAVGRGAKHKIVSNTASGNTDAWLSRWQKYFVGALAALEAYNTVVHPLMFGHSRLQFVPLLLTSTVCAVGMLAAWICTASALLTERSNFKSD